MQSSINLVAALLAFNQLRLVDGCDTFDADKDGKTSLRDLKTAMQHLDLNLDSGRGIIGRGIICLCGPERRGVCIADNCLLMRSGAKPWHARIQKMSSSHRMSQPTGKEKPDEPDGGDRQRVF